MNKWIKKQNYSQIRKRGFSLIELMISIAIIGTLSAIAIPNYISYRQRAEYAALQQTLKHFMDAEDLYFLENAKFYPERGRIVIRKGRQTKIPELHCSFGSAPKHRFIIRGRNLVNRRGRKINGYWIDVRCGFDFNGNGRKDRIRFTTLYRNGKLVQNRAFRQFR